MIQNRPKIKFDPIGAVNINFDFLMEEESDESDSSDYDSYGILNYQHLENDIEVSRLIEELNMMQLDINSF